MGKMALGYGSEFHLLRWIGRHRNEFDVRVKKLLAINNINWLDFNFYTKNESLDKELVGLEFLENEPEFNKVMNIWKKEWPQSGNSMNWDLVGYELDNNKKTWILVEAKAHLGELEQSCEAISPVSKEKINRALIKAAINNGIEVHNDKPLMKKYYQFANRIYILDLLKRNGINAKLLNIYFVGDRVFKNRKSPKNKEEWQIKLNDMKDYLPVQNSDLKVYDLYLDINK